MPNYRQLLNGIGGAGGAIGAGTYGVLDQYKDEPWVGDLREFMHPDPRNRMGQTVEPATDEAAMAQDAREMAARRVRGELAPSAAVERRFGAFAEPSLPPGPTRDEAFQMGGLADMGDYKEAPATVWRDTDVAGAERDVAPDPGMNLFAASPQQSRVATAHAGPVDALLIPTSPADLALMSLGPAGKIAGVPGKVAAMTAGLMASGIDPAEAGVLDKIGKVLGGKPGGPHPGGIHVYHSSPHDFDKFDWSKLRTGEGANVYGSGFYFAENPQVSGQGGQYWDQFARNRFAYDPTPEGMATRALMETKADRAAAIAKLSNPKYQEHLQHFLPNSYFKNVDPKEALKLLESSAPVGPRTYEVNINARPELLLDWDKPLSKQSAEVKEGINRRFYNQYDDPQSGETIYRDMVRQASARHDQPGDYVAEQLQRAGIPGIRYLDQGSRMPDARAANFERRIATAKQQGQPFEHWQTALDEHLKAVPPPSYNYVVTDPSKLDILAKYGIVGGAPIGMGALAAQDRYQQ